MTTPGYDPTNPQLSQASILGGEPKAMHLSSLFLTASMIFASGCGTSSPAQGPATVPYSGELSLQARALDVRYESSIDSVVFEMRVEGDAGRVRPTPAGQVDGAPVVGYVFPTTLLSTDVGFDAVDGTVALAITSHPDFDDTPLWDEDNDRNYANDGKIWHPHWVVLTKDKRVKGGLAVKQFDKNKDKVTLPPTNPGMPMYMDSPGHSVVVKNKTLRVLVPLARLNNRTDFKFDAVAAYMQVMPKGNLPLLGVYEVYSVWSGDLSLPGKVKR